MSEKNPAEMIKENKKTKSRGNGEGSIYYNGRYWVGQITLGRDSVTNKLKRKSFYDKTRKAVREKMNTALYKKNTDDYTEPSKMLVNDWADYWLLNFKKPQISETTYHNYEITIKNHVKNIFGFVALRNLNTFQIQEYYNLLSEKGTSSGYIKLIHNSFSAMMKQAVKLNMISKNPLEEVILPRSTKKQSLKVLTVDQQKKLVDYCYLKQKCFIFIFLLGTGLRIGEALALTWDNVDFENHTIQINHTLIRINGKLKCKEGAKTNKSIRVVPLAQKTESVLFLIKQYQIEKDNKLNLVFPSIRNHYEDMITVESRMKYVCQQCGIDSFTPHALRHTFATRMIEQGVNVKVISELLGHSDIKITLNTYAHILEETLHGHMDKINEYL